MTTKEAKSLKEGDILYYTGRSETFNKFFKENYLLEYKPISNTSGVIKGICIKSLLDPSRVGKEQTFLTSDVSKYIPEPGFTTDTLLELLDKLEEKLNYEKTNDNNTIIYSK